MTDHPAKALALRVYLAAVFLDILGMVVTAPLMPFIGPILDIPVQWYGAVLAVYPGGVIFSSLATGRLLQHIGFRRLSIAMASGTCLSFVLLGLSGLATSLPLYVAGRCMGGLFASAPTIAQAFICTFPEERRLHLFVSYGTVLSLSLLSGQFVLLLAEIHYFAPLWLCLCLSALFLPMCCLFAAEETRTGRGCSSMPLSDDKKINRRALAVVFTADMFMIADVSCFISTALPVIYVELYELRPYQISALTFGQMVIGIVMRETVVKWTLLRFESKQVRLALVAFVGSVLVHLPFYALGPGSFWIRAFPAFCCFTVAYNITFPLCQASIQGALAKFAGGEKALVMGLREVVLSLGRVGFGPLGTLLITFPYPFGPLFVSSCCALLATFSWIVVLHAYSPNLASNKTTKQSVRL